MTIFVRVAVCSPKTQRLITHYFKPSSGRESRKPDVNLRLTAHRFRKKFLAHSDCVCVRCPCAFRVLKDWTEFEIYVIVNDSYVSVGEAKLDEYHALEYIEIKESHRRRGLGSRLVRFIQRSLPECHVYGGVEPKSCHNLTALGRALIASCVRNGSLKYDNFLEASGPPSP